MLMHAIDAAERKKADKVGAPIWRNTELRKSSASIEHVEIVH
jgi:hypothetical protein